MTSLTEVRIPFVTNHSMVNFPIFSLYIMVKQMMAACTFQAPFELCSKSGLSTPAMLTARSS